MTSFAPVLELPDRLALLKRLPRRGVVAEVGVQRGDFAAEILRRCEPRLLLLIDGWLHQTSGPYGLDKSNVSQPEHDRFYSDVCARFLQEQAAGQVVILRGLSSAVFPLLPDGWLDWIYLDADHSYEAVRQDLAWCARKVKAGGFIAGHDYVEAPHQGFGVVQAVTEFCQQERWQLVARTCNDRLCEGYDSYLLRRSCDRCDPWPTPADATEQENKG